MAEPDVCDQMENVRSSSRLKEKYQRKFTLPDRKEELDRLVPDDKTPFKNLDNYKPRKLINNFIKERYSYNNPDKIDLYDEFSDEDFIDDNPSSDDDSDTEASSVSQRKGRARRKASSSADSSANDAWSVESIEKPVSRNRSTRRKLSSRLTRVRDEQSDSEEELAKPLKMHKQRLPGGRSSGSEMSSEDDDLSEPFQRKKRRVRPSVQSDGEEDDEIQPVASVPDPVSGEKGSEQSKTPVSKGDKDPDLEEDDEQPDSGNEQNSSSSFIATSSSSDSDREHDWSYFKGSSLNKPSHEELICNYRQEKRPRKKSRASKKRRVLIPSESDSEGSGPEEPDTGSMEQRRPASKRAERLLRKKTAWKTEVLGNYKEKREKKLAHEKQRKNTK